MPQVVFCPQPNTKRKAAAGSRCLRPPPWRRTPRPLEPPAVAAIGVWPRWHLAMGVPAASHFDVRRGKHGLRARPARGGLAGETTVSVAIDLRGRPLSSPAAKGLRRPQHGGCARARQASGGELCTGWARRNIEPNTEEPNTKPVAPGAGVETKGCKSHCKNAEDTRMIGPRMDLAAARCLRAQAKYLGFVKIAHGLCRICLGPRQSSAAMIRHPLSIASRLDPRRGQDTSPPAPRASSADRAK